MIATLARRFAFARPSAEMRLPLRVRKALEHEQYRAELLVTAVQLLITATLAVLYAATPPGFSPDAPLQAAPLGLALFGELALLRLYFALTGQLSRGILGVTVVAEMALLIFVLWAYHLQYEQPPQFSLKSSEFAYVFILIGLRALRFEPLWVILSGLTAALGWTGLLAWAVLAAPDNPVTWDYVTALRSTQIHFGAEFDKLLAIVVVTAVLALALARARRSRWWLCAAAQVRRRSRWSTRWLPPPPTLLPVQPAAQPLTRRRQLLSCGRSAGWRRRTV
jgi:adenylate cyclase